MNETWVLGQLCRKQMSAGHGKLVAICQVTKLPPFERAFSPFNTTTNKNMQKRKRLGSYVLAIKNILTIVFAKKGKKKIIICNK